MSLATLNGQVVFYTYVSFAGDKNKRITLHREHNCDYVQRHAVVEAFKSLNPQIKSSEIHAHFMFSDYIS